MVEDIVEEKAAVEKEEWKVLSIPVWRVEMESGDDGRVAGGVKNCGAGIANFGGSGVRQSLRVSAWVRVSPRLTLSNTFFSFFLSRSLGWMSEIPVSLTRTSSAFSI